MALKYVLFAFTCYMAYTSAISELQPNQPDFNITLGASDAIIYNCWNTITNIGSCANEIIGFFARGTIDHISKRCRREINLITQQCWPALFTALGITPEECNMLLGFCGTSTGLAPPPSVRYPTPPAGRNKAIPAKN